LSCQDLTGYVHDDQIATKYLAETGEYKVTTIPWDNDANWSEFDLVVIRTTWDYTQRPKEFVEKLKFISSQTKLINTPEIVEWNCHKKYLKELESKGVKIVPTKIFNYPCEITSPTEWKAQRFIIKPAISATSYKTMIVTESELKSEKLKNELFPGDWLLQPFLENIGEGEISLVFFQKEFSHSLIKIPKAGDFRVQEEFGGEVHSFTPDQKLINLAEHIIQSIPFDLKYGRVDLVKSGEEYLLMELELIEPSLYLRTHDQAVINFERALRSAL
jgi:glutathione synthase/RimK-type ligase-like ATP-grasp enzyme